MLLCIRRGREANSGPVGKGDGAENGRSVKQSLYPVYALYDAAGSSRIEYDEWDWLQEQAPPVSWWRDWDKCERLAAALARLLVKQNASLETVFGIVYSREAIRKVAAILDDDRDTRPYLKSLRKTAEDASGIGTREQRDALLEDW